MEQKDAHFRLRIPSSLKEWVDASARKNRRSINAEIIFLLTEAKQMRADANEEFNSQNTEDFLETKRFGFRMQSITNEELATILLNRLRSGKQKNPAGDDPE